MSERTPRERDRGPYRSEIRIGATGKVSLLEPDRPSTSTLLGEGPADESTVLDFPGTDRRRRRRGWLFGAAVTLVLVAALIAVLVFSPVLAMRHVSVSGNRLTTSKAVSDALSSLQGTPLPQITRDEVRNRLASMPAVEDVSVEARPPSTLAVTVHERTPVAILKENEKYLLIDQNGTQLATATERSAVSLPIIDGGTAVIGKDVFRAITAVLAALPADVLAKMEHASATSVDSVELTLLDGKKVVWGNSSQRELKAKVLAALIARPQDPDTPAVQTYDVSTPSRPVTR
ncbi:cell division protein FtsQ [Tersicoccus solisilvae]|uniref:Cell division protein FtsQ n=1 Tax=Tersicoccus solisilvae TaxID=1882339 RepID=A0ABQ1PCG8_9MICC|nr:FtsQ-type POTRA domain-containing protein [Tersicoccus solisilvae]GGC94532.1 cell division protein FtsQ [Tersicoccus solisilvae]